MVEKRDFPSDISVLNYAFYDDLFEVIDWVSTRDGEIQCIAAADRVAAALSHPRTVPLGRTQRPSLADYPDGCDTMEFLMNL